MAVERIDAQCGNVKAKHALVWNEKVSGKRPLLLVMPNWLGVTEPAIKRAQKMAGDKYVAMVVDMYGEGLERIVGALDEDELSALARDEIVGGLSAEARLGHQRTVDGISAMATDAVFIGIRRPTRILAQ